MNCDLIMASEAKQNRMNPFREFFSFRELYHAMYFMQVM